MEQQNQQPIQEKTENKPPIKTNWRYIAIIALVAIILAVGGILLFAYLSKSTGVNPVTYDQCRQLEQEVNTLIKQASYCEADDDCAIASDINKGPCGCGGSVVNKNAELTDVKAKIQKWNQSCVDQRILCTCPPKPELIKCQENQCVGIWYAPVQIQDLKQNPSGWQQKIVVEGVYRWGFEDSNFDETADSKEYNIWVEATAKTKLENTPGNYLDYISGPQKTLNPYAKVTIYGTFHAGNPDQKVGYGHLGLWKHQIVADKIVFESSRQEVEAVTDKTVYSQNKEVVVEIKNNLAKDIWVAGLCGAPFILQQYNDNAGEWKNNGPDPTKGCIAPAQNIQAGARFVYRVNLAQVYAHKNFQIEPGRYRFLFRYSFANPDLAGQKMQYFDAFSNEFRISGGQTSQFNAKIVGSYTSPGESSKLAYSARTVYLTDISQGLLAIDVIDPTNPKLLDSFKVDGGGAYAVSFTVFPYHAQLLVGGYGNSNVVIFEVDDSGGKLNLQPFKEFNAKRSVQEAFSLGYMNFLSIDGPEFEIYNSSTGESRIIRGTPGGHILDFAVTDSLDPIYVPILLAAQGEKGIAVFDLSGDVFDPVLLELLNLEGYTYAVDGGDTLGYSYALSGNEFIVIGIGSVSSDKILEPLGRTSLNGTGVDLDVENDVGSGIAAIAMGDKGVTFIDVSDPDNPLILGTVDTPGRARDVELVYAYTAYYAYVADDRDDLQIIEVRR